MQNHKQNILVLVVTLVLVACGGGGGDTPATVETPTPATTEPVPTPATVACTAATIASTGYSAVFKGCDLANIASYYERTECVRDNATGLIWQGQTISGLRANNQDKTNFDSTSALQKYDASVAGSYRAPIASEINAVSNSVGYTNAVNATNLCGFSNWRIPSKDELQSIVKPSETPKIDNAWFPNTPAVAWYWSSTGYAANSAYGVVISTGASSWGVRVGVSGTGANLVRLVRN